MRYYEDMDLYAETILDHYRHPRGQEFLHSPTVEHEEVNLACGDGLKLQLIISGGKIAGIGWSGTGCAISQAAMSMLWEELEGTTLTEVAQMTPRSIYALLGVPVGPRRFKCALLCLHALKNAVRKSEGKKVQGWLETVALGDQLVAGSW